MIGPSCVRGGTKSSQAVSPPMFVADRRAVEKLTRYRETSTSIGQSKGKISLG